MNRHSTEELIPSLNRRRLLQGASALVFLPAAQALAQGTTAPPRPGGLIPRTETPVNLEFPFATLRDFITPNDQFYVRNHFAQPKVEARDWRLEVGGRVRNSFALTYDELLRLPTRRQIALLECAGNGRSFLEPKTRGVQWELGAVGTAEWMGVPLGEVLRRAGVRSGSAEVILEGMDEGTVAEGPGTVRFARSVLLSKAREDVLLAYRMNGAELPPSHGFPVRAIVPGWYGVSSVKWLSRITVTDQPFRGYFQSVDYTYWAARDGGPQLVPLTELQPKAQIARPAGRETVSAGQPYRVFGAAWTGESEIERVEVSTDGGRTWTPARLLGEPLRYAWRLWEFPWTAPAQGGTHVLLARATDRKGQIQAATRDTNRRNYMITHSLPVEVTVRG